MTKHKQTGMIFLMCIFFYICFFQANAISSLLSDTGQNECYNNTEKMSSCPQKGDAFFGQDASYTINSPRYIKLDENGNQLDSADNEWVMVQDNYTGLIWEVKTEDNYLEKYTISESQTYIDSLNDNSFGGYTDWRIPSIEELGTIKNYGDYTCSIDLKFFPHTQPSLYCSSTKRNSEDNYIFVAIFSNGLNTLKPINESVFIRAVRGKQSITLTHLVINPDTTVTDTQTGLMWQTKNLNEKANWQQAINLCENLESAGYTDWRMPNIKEFDPFISRNRQLDYITIDQYFPDINSKTYWSSTTYSNIPSKAWTANFNVGANISSESKNDTFYYAVVRGGQKDISDHIFITHPQQGAALQTGQNITITWEPRGTSGEVKISLSRKGGRNNTYDTDIALTENDGSFNWDITGIVPSVNCVLRIEPQNDLLKGTTQGLFSIADGEPPVLSMIKNQDVFENTINFPIQYTVLDSSGSQITIIAHSSNTELLDNTGIDLGGENPLNITQVSDAFDPVTLSMKISPEKDMTGSTIITLFAQDVGGLTAVNTFILTVNKLNTAPEIYSINDQEIYEDAPLSISFSVTDTNNDPIDLTVVSSNKILVPENDDHMVISELGSNLILSITPAANESGILTLTVIASDPDGLTDSKHFLLNILPVNDPPFFSSTTSEMTTNENAPVTITLHIDDIDDNTFSFQGFSSNTMLVPESNQHMVFFESPANHYLAITPVHNSDGKTTITIIAYDSAGLTAETHFTLTVKSVNVAPIIDPIADLTINEDESKSISISLTDTNNDPIDLTLVSSNKLLVPENIANMSVSVSGNNRILSISPAANEFGNTTITLIASDDSGLTDSESFILTVVPVNDPPVISPINNTLSKMDHSLTINVYVSDIDNSADTLILSAFSSNTTLVPEDSTHLNVTGSGNQRLLYIQPVSNQEGNTTIHLIVQDIGGLTASESFMLTILSKNTSPEITDISDITTEEDIPVTLTVHASDLDGDELQLNAFSSNTSLIPQSNINVTKQNSGHDFLLKLVPLPDEYGYTTISVVAADPDGLTAIKQFMINIKSVNDPPVLESINNITTKENEPVAINIHVSDIEGDMLSFSGYSSNTRLVPENSDHFKFYASLANEYLVITPAQNRYGQTIITLIADDGQESDSINFLLTVETDNPFIITHIDPVENSAGNSIDSIITIVFSRNIDESSINMNTFMINEPVEGELSYAGKEIRFTPEASFQKDTQYYFTLTTDIADSDGNYLENTFSWEMSTYANDPPETPVAVTPETEQNIKLLSDNWVLEASVYKDNDGDYHLQTQWIVRKAGCPYFEDNADDSFHTISTSDLTSHIVYGLKSGLKYYWKVGYMDDGTKRYSWSKEYSFKTGESVSGSKYEISTGEDMDDFNMISIVQWPDNPSAKNVFGPLLEEGYDTKEYRIGTYDPLKNGGSYVEYGNDLVVVPGAAYWFFTRKELQSNISGIPVSKDEDIEIPLRYNPDNGNGWNMIACPNEANYKWEDVEVVAYDADGHIEFGPVPMRAINSTNTLINPRLWRWQDGSYFSDTTLMEKYSGYWVSVKAKNVSLRFPKIAQLKKSKVQKLLTHYLHNVNALLSKTSLIPTTAIANTNDSPPLPIGYNTQGSMSSDSRGCFINTLFQ
jgi:hypothetical protein